MNGTVEPRNFSKQDGGPKSWGGQKMHSHLQLEMEEVIEVDGVRIYIAVVLNMALSFKEHLVVIAGKTEAYVKAPLGWRSWIWDTKSVDIYGKSGGALRSLM